MNIVDRKIADTFKQCMIGANLPILDVIAFGSRCRGDNEPDSDLDVLVIVEEKNTSIRNQISHCAWEVSYEAGVVIQSVVMTREQVEIGPEKSSLLMMAIQQEGQRI